LLKFCPCHDGTLTTVVDKDVCNNKKLYQEKNTMKKFILAALAIVLVATPALATIVGTSHDLTLIDAGSNDKVCVYCHTPHGASATANTPLWNRTITISAATAVYTNTTLTAEAAGVAIADIALTEAFLCISCHDGTVTTGLLNEPNSGDTNIAAAPATMDTGFDGDFSDDHPIGFDYTIAQGADAGLKVRATVEGVLGTDVFSFGVSGNDMWCSSCHDVHNGTNGQFLRVSNTASALCIACHDK
jgi:predicted CXXCH cytochrome family protein